MNIFSKKLKEYFTAFRVFLAVVFILTLINVILRLSFDLPPGISSFLILVAAIMTSWAGWKSVREYGYDFRQTAFVGFLFFLATNWSLLIFHPVSDVLFYILILVNSFLFVMFASLGGLLAKQFKRYQESKNSDLD
ncbi:MAG: hypothetical protein JSV96_10945 [Candidatus Aminicenantes bacterium]|nr:MAG: hypothetical protein JSV96_10945 [Candidatus Aminicenantes bacterium]